MFCCGSQGFHLDVDRKRNYRWQRHLSGKRDRSTVPRKPQLHHAGLQQRQAEARKMPGEGILSNLPYRLLNLRCTWCRKPHRARS